MADDAGRFEAEIDVDVSFNEFDVELCNFNERRGKNNEERITADDNRHDTKLISHRAANECEPRATKCTGATECAPNLQVMKEEDGEISSSSDDEGDEKMDCDEETAIDLNTVSHESKKSAEDSEKTDNFTFLSPNSVFKDFGKKECLEENFASGACKRDYETESAILSMESDNSMDDQSWKRQKRPKLEQVSQEVGEGNSTHRKDEERKKTRGGRKKRKRPLRSHHEYQPRHRSSRYNNNERESGNEKLFKPLKVTAEDSEEDVAREIANKLNESKTMLIERVVTCIGCEKAIKLFKDTQEVERHGGMQTKEGDRRRTSGGVFLVLLKHKYVTKEQSKWIFAVENELFKKKAKQEQQRMKELHKRNVADLRLKLKERDNE